MYVKTDAMKKPSCEVLVYYPKISEVEDLRSSVIANCVVNNFLCYTAIMLNIVTIHAIRKTSSLPKTLRTLLLSLAVSDVAVGSLSQPLFTSLLVKGLQEVNSSCNTYKAFEIIISLFSGASFFGVVAISVDRFLAIHLHLRYQELVTHKRVVAVVISIWVFSAFFPLMVLWAPLDIYFLMIFIFGILGVVLTALVYFRIYFTVRRHKNQILVLQLQQEEENGELSNFSSVVKSAGGVFYVYLVFLMCYLPFLVVLATSVINGPSIPLKRVFLFSLTLVFLNSSVNPVIYCWKMRHIRHAIMDILRNIFWIRNRTSH